MTPGSPRTPTTWPFLAVRPAGRPPTAHCFARHLTSGWKTDYATTAARTKPSAMIEPDKQTSGSIGRRSLEVRPAVGHARRRKN